MTFEEELTGFMKYLIACWNSKLKIPLNSRTKVAANEPVGQMTIFYGGKVNVYDDVPGDKVMKLLFSLSNTAIYVILNWLCNVIKWF